MAKFLFAAFLLLFAAIANPVSEVKAASSHNMAISQNLLGAKNPCGVPERKASMDDPFTVAYIQAIAILPSVGNITSDLSNTSLVWGWAASYPKSVAFSLPSDGTCPPGELALYSPSSARLEEGTLSYSYFGENRLVPLGMPGTNPVPLPLARQELSDEPSFSLFASLEVKLEGRVEADYDFLKTEYRYSCITVKGYSSCGCERVSSSGRKTYAKTVEHSRVFLVENGPSYLFWLNPPLAKRLSGGQEASLLLLLRRMPSEISMASNGQKIAFSSPYSFYLQDGKCGEKVANAVFAPFDSLEKGLNSSNPIDMRQFAGKNLTYLPVHFWFSWNESPGEKDVAVEVEDFFGHNESFTRKFNVRSPAAWEKNQEKADSLAAMLVSHGDKTSPPSSYPAPEAQAPESKKSAIPFVLGMMMVLGASFFIHILLRFWLR